MARGRKPVPSARELRARKARERLANLTANLRLLRQQIRMLESLGKQLDSDRKSLLELLAELGEAEGGESGRDDDGKSGPDPA